MIAKPYPLHKQVWEFHLEDVSTGIYLQNIWIYMAKGDARSGDTRNETIFSSQFMHHFY